MLLEKWAPTYRCPKPQKLPHVYTSSLPATLDSHCLVEINLQIQKSYIVKTNIAPTIKHWNKFSILHKFNQYILFEKTPVYLAKSWFSKIIENFIKGKELNNFSDQ